MEKVSETVSMVDTYLREPLKSLSSLPSLLGMTLTLLTQRQTSEVSGAGV